MVMVVVGWFIMVVLVVMVMIWLFFFSIMFSVCRFRFFI